MHDVCKIVNQLWFAVATLVGAFLFVRATIVTRFKKNNASPYRH